MIFRVAAGLGAKIELAFLHPLLFRLDFGFWELAWCPGAAEQPLRVLALQVGPMKISYAGHYHSCMINGFVQTERGKKVDFWMLSFGCLSEAPNR